MFTFPVSHWASAGLVTPIVVGNLGMPNGSPNPDSLVINRDCPAGSVLAVFLESIDSAVWASVGPDSRGNIYMQNLSASSSTLRQSVWYTVLASALHVGDTIPINHTSDSTARAVSIPENAPASPLDLSTAPYTGSGVSASATVPVRSASPEVIFSWFTQHTFPGPSGNTPGNGFQNLDVNSSSALSYLTTRSLLALPFSCSWTSGVTNFMGTFVSFKL